jgi:cardiolipin synthase C
MAPATPRVVWAALLLSAASIRGRGSLPSQQNRRASSALEPSPVTSLGAAVTPLALRHPELSGVVDIPDGRASFGTLVALARAAAHSIDIQTYIWHADTTGTVPYDEMR